jgi:hypothetical protein
MELAERVMLMISVFEIGFGFSSADAAETATDHFHLPSSLD